MAIKILSVSDFTGGRNSKASSPSLAKNESLDQQSVWCYNNALVKRPGSSSVACTVSSIANAPIKMVLTNLGASGVNRMVMMGLFTGAAYGRLVYTDDGTTFVNCEGTPTQFSATKIPYMGMFGAYLYVSDGTNTVVRYDGTTVTTVSAFPKYAKCEVHKNYMFSANGKTLYWSTLNDPTTLPASNFQTVDIGMGDSIIALKSFGGNLIVLCRHSMWLLVGDVFDPVEVNYYLQKIDVPSNFNFLAGQTIVVHQGIVKFLAVGGFYAYAGGTGIVKISDPVQTDTDSITWANIALNGDNNLTAPRAYVWKDNMYCTFLISSAMKFMVQDNKGKWWLWAEPVLDGYPFDMIAANLGSGEKLYAGNNGYSIFQTLDTGNNCGTTLPNTPSAFSAYWISKDFSLPNESKFLYADIYLKKQAAVATLGTLVFSYSLDGAAFITANVDMINGVGTILKKRVPIMRIGRSIRVKVLNAELGVTFEVYQINISYEPTSAMR